MSEDLPNVCKPQDFPDETEYIEFYEEFLTQADNFWTPTKVDVEADVREMTDDADPALHHGILHNLKLFTNIEIFVGEDMWAWVSKTYPKFSISCYAMLASGMEAVHAAQYSRWAAHAKLANKEFYHSYKLNPDLAKRMDNLNKYANESDRLKRITYFSAILEGCALYSAFAFMMNPSRMRNKYTKIKEFLQYSVRDESGHSRMGCRLAKIDWEEQGKPDRPWLRPMFEEFYAVECANIDEMFAGGEVEGIDPENLKAFVRNRMRRKVKELGAEPWFDKEEENISIWFEPLTLNQDDDFFVNNPASYTTNFKKNDIDTTTEVPKLW